MIIIILIVLSSLINMIADILLVSGKDNKIKNQEVMDIINKTPNKNIYLSGMIGVFSLAVWMSLLYFLSYLKGRVGLFVIISYAMFIGSIMVFHVSCSTIFLFAKNSLVNHKRLKKLLMFYAIPTIIFSLMYTGGMIYLGLTEVLRMNMIHYITLPIFSTIIIQIILGNIIPIKHFDSISGTLSMLISMLSTIHIIVTNFNLTI